MSKIGNDYQAAYYSGTVQAKGSKETEDAKGKKTRETEKAEQSSKADRTKLSKAAQDMLEKLKKKYGNMDIMVGDFKNGDDARQILSRGTKEFSVLFSVDELEKMASSEKAEKEYTDKIEGAVRMSEQISREYGFGRDGEKGEINRIGISFNKDGSVSYFAELEKSSEQQRERIERTREKHARDKKDAARKEDREQPMVKRTTVEASSAEQLIRKMNQVDWGKIPEEQIGEGDKIDFSA